MNKIPGVPKKSIVVATSNPTGPKVNTNQGVKYGSQPVMAKIQHPTLDDKHRFLLEGKTDRVDGLLCVHVKFFPGNLTEVSYEVEDDDGEKHVLTTSDFQTYRNAIKRKAVGIEEVKASKGFVSKLEKRTLLSFQDDSVENVRRVQASKMPGPAERMMGLTQEQFKAKGFHEEGKLLLYWKGLPESAIASMDAYQNGVLEAATSWSERLASMVADFNDRVEKSALKRAEKLSVKTKSPGLIKPGEAWADSMEENVPSEEEVVKTPAPEAKKGGIANAILKVGKQMFTPKEPAVGPDKFGSTSEQSSKVVATASVTEF